MKNTIIYFTGLLIILVACAGLNDVGIAGGFFIFGIGTVLYGIVTGVSKIK